MKKLKFVNFVCCCNKFIYIWGEGGGGGGESDVVKRRNIFVSKICYRHCFQSPVYQPSRISPEVGVKTIVLCFV